jgi:AhpD family alkylhydroperoxidase
MVADHQGVWDQGGAAAPALMQSWLDFGKDVLRRGLEDSLMELVKIRAPQINGCAYCPHMHTAAAATASSAGVRGTPIPWDLRAAEIEGELEAFRLLYRQIRG